MLKKGFFITTILAIIASAYLIGTNLQTASSNAPVTIAGTTVPSIPTLNPGSIARGKHVYDNYCASCHGIDLKGVADWKKMQPDGSYLPPPHDSSGHTWHHSDPVLIEIISNGGDPTLYNTKMPGFSDQLTDIEIEAVLDYIKSHWEREERESQWWVTVNGI